MEYQKIANILDSALNQPSKFTTKNWVEINDESRGVYTTGSDIRLKQQCLSSSLCDFSNAYILVKGNIPVNNTAAPDAAPNNTNKKVIFKNCAPFAICINRINNKHLDTAQDIS